MPVLEVLEIQNVVEPWLQVRVLVQGGDLFRWGQVPVVPEVQNGERTHGWGFPK